MDGYFILVRGMQMGICHRTVNFHCNLFSQISNLHLADLYQAYIHKYAQQNHFMHGYQNLK